VDSGYWPLYRWNPLLEKKERNHLGKQVPDFSPTLSDSMDQKLDHFLNASFEQLSKKIGDTSKGKKSHLLILCGSDHGNAEAIPFKLACITFLISFPSNALVYSLNIAFITCFYHSLIF